LLHVALDTSIYTADRTRRNGPFRALTRLLRGKKAQLHVPYVVKHEFVTQRASEIKRSLKSIRQAAQEIENETSDETLLGYTSGTKKTCADLKAKLSDLISVEFETWLKVCHAIVYPVGTDHGARVVADYFKGSQPFKEAKNRNDFPDGFVWQTMLDLVKDHQPLYVVVNDGALFNAAKSTKGMQAHMDLEHFIATKECQDALAKLTGEIIAKNIKRVKTIIPKKNSTLTKMLESDIVNALAYRTIHDHYFSEDSNEAVISMVGDASPEFDFDNIEYYGGSEIGIPFTGTSECTLDYPMFKSEYFLMDDDQSAKISVTSLNDHFFEAQQDFPIGVRGTLSVEIPTKTLEDADVSRRDLESSIENGEHKVEIEETWIVEDSKRGLAPS
jgi:hypothetical protein